MDTFLCILAVIAGLAGIIGSVLPVVPGPPVSWLGLLCAYFAGGTNGAGETMSTAFLLIWLGIVTVAAALDYIIPIYFTRLAGGTKAASWGTVIGLIVGIIWPPVGMIAGAFFGAFIAELVWAGKNPGTALKSAAGSFAGFIAGTGMKLIVTGVMMYYIIVYL